MTEQGKAPAAGSAEEPPRPEHKPWDRLGSLYCAHVWYDKTCADCRIANFVDPPPEAKKK